MKTDPPLGDLREASEAEVDWLIEQDPKGSLGYAPLGWPAETWVLHMMWEDPDPVDVLSEEERWQLEHPGEKGIGTLLYGSAAFNDLPPPEWPRLRWRELADRLGEPLGAEWEGQPLPPCFRWFSYRSWPESIWTPAEGTLDAPTGDRLIQVLADHSPKGLETPCFCFYDILDSPDRMERLVLSGPLRAVFDAARYSSTGYDPTPDNIWPADRSWLLWTEHDLWSTRVIGTPEVVAAVEADPELETAAHIHQRRPPRAKDDART